MSTTSIDERSEGAGGGAPNGSAGGTGARPRGIDRLKDRIPDHAKDLRINLGVIAGATTLTLQQAWGTAVAAAVTSRNPEVIAAIEEAASAHLSPEALSAARGAASIMGMNNVYYRFLHMMGDGSEYHRMPARLRMQIIGKQGSSHPEVPELRQRHVRYPDARALWRLDQMTCGPDDVRTISAWQRP